MQIEARARDFEIGQQLNETLNLPAVKADLERIMSNPEPFQTVNINLDIVREFAPDLVSEIIARPVEMTKAMEVSIKTKIAEKTGVQVSYDQPTWRVAFEGNLGRNTITPRGLKSRLLGQLVKVQGIVTSTGKVRHRLLKSTHVCEATGEYKYYNYRDLLSLRKDQPENIEYMTNVLLYDENSRPLTMEYGFSDYKDIQVVTIQEMPENIPTGQLSRSIEVVVQEDLVDVMKPGDRVQVTGIFQVTPSGSTFRIGTFRSCVVATSVTLLTSVGEVNLSAKEIKSVREISKRPDLLQLLIRSLAPSICGHEEIKEGLLVQLLGGTEKVFDKAMRLRGDINVLLVGDPSTGKSQFLRRMMTLSSLAFSTTGRGSTGVGLTAAVIFDKDTGEKHLEAGAMVLADRGIICVDEFDKMSIEDRVAMHEVMEQQTVTIAKAGIHVSLNARCSVLAAANPRYGEYEDRRSVETNINMPPSLLSRFDLIFVVRDKHDHDIDRKISMRVTKNHRFEGAVGNQYTANDSSGFVQPDLVPKGAESAEVFEQFNRFLHEDKSYQYLKVEFLKKYIQYAKMLKPELTDETNELICRKWAKLRGIDDAQVKNTGNRIIAQTIRSLESLIRLATAYAKMRLSQKVEIVDVLRAFQIFNRAYYGGTEVVDKGFWDDTEIPADLLNEMRNLKIGGRDERPVQRPFVPERKNTNGRPVPVRAHHAEHGNQRLAQAAHTQQMEIESENLHAAVHAAPKFELDLDKDPVKTFRREYNQRANLARGKGVSRTELYQSMRKAFTPAISQEDFDVIVNYLIEQSCIMEVGGELFQLG